MSDHLEHKDLIADQRTSWDEQDEETLQQAYDDLKAKADRLAEALEIAYEMLKIQKPRLKLNFARKVLKEYKYTEVG